MDRLNNNGGRGQVLCLSQGECTTRSIVKALDNFLTAVQRMKDTVMVPSRLIDMTTSVGELREALNSPQEPNALVAIPSNMVTSSLPLYSFYQMLQMIRNQLVSGPAADDVDSDENGADEQCRHLSHAFQQHLQGLFSVLRQLTDTANYLTKRYQDEVDAAYFLFFFFKIIRYLLTVMVLTAKFLHLYLKITFIQNLLYICEFQILSGNLP
ncbi:Mid1-interacting protein 1A [Trichinella pseudospiralis]|uniref:Mid1-interacting protein 1A n=1 Tax=Trichinella pseudospiralis TaxID=6337 RepID=A0A0V0XYU5_TRIPS|nr:Mid1-interacting protein 1A [Trichinella pseudospiralis]